MSREVAFTERESIGPYGQRGTAWPGRCAGWRTTYSLGSAEVEIAMTLYKTHKQALTALAEPALGPVEKLSNGALVRKRRGRISIAGVPARHWLVASVYRNVFSISTSTADKPISLSAQSRSIAASMKACSRWASAINAPSSLGDDHAVREIPIYLKTEQAMNRNAHARIVGEGETG